MLSHSGFIYKIIGIGFIFFYLLSCAPRPEIEWVPEIKSVSAKVSDNTCVLTAETSADLADGYACGFFYGKTQDNMRRLQVSPDGKKFNLTLESLDYETEYFYKAYVSNGRNEISSDLRHFRTLKEKEVPRTMTLPFNTIEIDPEETEFVLEVGGDAEFTVNIPDTVSWIFFRRDNRNCRFQVKANMEAVDRCCDVVFTNLSDNQCDTLVVIQTAKVNAGNLPEYLKEVPYCSSTFGVSLYDGSLDDIRFVPDGSQNADWIRWDRAENSGFTKLEFYIDENTTDEERTCNLIITYDGEDNFLTLWQKTADGIIKFEDPLVKQACVDAFDLDSDGELSYYEAAIPDNIDGLNFSQMDIKSFDEFQWFVNVKEIREQIFAESKIESIKFPYAFSVLHDAVFLLCRELVDIDLSDILVHSALSGCESLENVEAKIAGIAAFEMCRSLNAVVQQRSGVPHAAFKECTNLRSFRFKITEPGVHYIGRRAFQGCAYLPEITIPADITEIQDDAFHSCISLSKVYMEPLDPPSLGEHVFVGTNEDLRIYVPYESLSNYKKAWEVLSSRIEPHDPEGVLMILPFDRSYFKYYGGNKSFNVKGEALFEVDLPSEVDWLNVTCTGKKCVLQVSPNNSFSERTCEVIFRNLSTGDSEVLTVRQSGIPAEETNLPFDVIYASYESKCYSFMLPADKFVLLEDYGDWLSVSHGSVGNSVHISIRVSENTTTEDRVGHVHIDYDGRNNVFTIIQKAYDSIIEFKDPVVKKVCVNAFDLDGDGELACWEASSVTGNGLDMLDFSGMEITSFDELCWFTDVEEIRRPIFAGSKLESIVFPFDIVVDDGVCEDCTELKNVDLNCCTIFDGVFKGCTSLKNVDVKYAGTASFEDCTGLETVSLRSALVSSHAFRNCTSIRLFEFSGEGGGSCHICEEAFAGCTSLPEITIISQITEIHDRAFYGCSSLSAVYMEPSVPPTLGEEVFAGTHPSLKIHVSPEAVALYRAAWPSLAHRIGSADDPGGEILPQEGDYVDEYGINHGQGVRIGETVWAPVNCGYHPLDFKYGKLYQWGRKYGQGYVGDICDLDGYSVGTSIDASEPEMVVGPVSLSEGESESNADKFYYNLDGMVTDWCSPSVDWLWNSGTENTPVKTEYDPCPDGWRVPTQAELKTLNDNHSSYTTDAKGQTGYWFSGSCPYTESVPQVFFPAAGFRHISGDPSLRGCKGKYWTSKSRGDGFAYYIHFEMGSIKDKYAISCLEGYSVRCVRAL